MATRRQIVSAAAATIAAAMASEAMAAVASSGQPQLDMNGWTDRSSSAWQRGRLARPSSGSSSCC